MAPLLTATLIWAGVIVFTIGSACAHQQPYRFLEHGGPDAPSWWTAGWDWSGVNNNWEPIGGVFPVGAPVAAVSRYRDQLDLFIIGNNGVIYTEWWTQGQDWSGRNAWRPIRGFFPTGV